MAGNPDLQSAFDAAIAQVGQCIAAGMVTSKGEPAAPYLEKLQRELHEERTRAVQTAVFDRAWFQTTLRWLVDWAPDDDLTLIAALGRIARAAPRALP